MDSISTILFLLLAVVISGTLARLTRLPLPLVQIGLGAVIAISVVPTVDLKPAIFFLLFLPPVSAAERFFLLLCNHLQIVTCPQPEFLPVLRSGNRVP